MISNILKPYEFLVVSREGQVIINKATQQDKLEAYIHQVYAITYENNYSKGCHAKQNTTSFQASFTTLPGISFKNNEFNNNLPKMYLLHVKQENKKLNRPKLGDAIHVQLPFIVLKCLKYTGPNP